MSAERFYLHEDDWGMIELVPVENRVQSEAVVAEARAHGEAHAAPEGGWSAVYVAPSPEVGIEVRRITLAALQECLGGEWRAHAGVDSGYASLREPVASAFALTDGSSVVYGSLAGELVSSLCTVPAEDARWLGRLGSAWRLVLVDLWRDEVVDLADSTAIERYLAG